MLNRIKTFSIPVFCILLTSACSSNKFITQANKGSLSKMHDKALVKQYQTNPLPETIQPRKNDSLNSKESINAVKSGYKEAFWLALLTAVFN